MEQLENREQRMEITSADISLATSDGDTFTAYTAAPAGEAAPGLVVIHEAWGVSPHIRSVADRFAREGFSVIAPDLLGIDVTIPPPVFLVGYRAVNALSPEERKDPERVARVAEAVDPAYREEFLTLLAAISRGATQQGRDMIAASVRWLKERGARKVGVLGFCFGGGYVWSYAFSGGEADAFVPFYGRLLSPPVPESVRAPLMGHYAELDGSIPVATIEDVADAIRAHGGEAVIHVYEGAGHAFFNDTRESYHAPSAALAWERTLGFLREKLS